MPIILTSFVLTRKHPIISQISIRSFQCVQGHNTQIGSDRLNVGRFAITEISYLVIGLFYDLMQPPHNN